MGPITPNITVTGNMTLGTVLISISYLGCHTTVNTTYPQLRQVLGALSLGQSLAKCPTTQIIILLDAKVEYTMEAGHTFVAIPAFHVDKFGIGTIRRFMIR